MDKAAKIKQERTLIAEMIALYCKKKHKTKGLCPECDELRAYAHERVDKCPYMESKTFCSNCKTHCYMPQMREKIRSVMRFSGPRIIFTHPVIALKHAYYSKIKK